MSFWETTATHDDDWFRPEDVGQTPEPQQVVQDKVPEIKVSIPDTKPVALMPAINDPVMSYRNQRRVGRGAFQPSEYNLAEIGRIEDTDGYVRQAFGKKVALMFKEGWDLVGKNPRTIKYVKTRLSQIAVASKTPTNTLFRKIGSGIVRKSNSFLVKVRKTEASGGKVRTFPGKNLQIKPVAGYFIVPAETMEFQLSGNTVSKWKQKMPDGEEKEHNVRDIVHFTHDKKDGFIFGTPTITPVIDDIRALRKIEENVELLIYQHLFPLFQYKVGTEQSPAGYTEQGEREIDVVKREIMYMPTEGGIVTPERHEITAIGSEGRALRAEGYVDHFKKRVFSGLGVSAVDMGEGETANRATADNMSRNLVDGVKDLQQILEDAINSEIINELLLESTFGEDVLEEDNIVRLKFKEIDVDAQIKKEAHSAQLFTQDVIDHDEARSRMGLEPWLVPSPDEVQSLSDTPEAYPQWHKSRWKLFQLPTLLIQAIDEPWSPAAKAAAADSSLPMTEKGNQESGKEQIDHEMELEKEKTRAKVEVAKNTPKPPPAKAATKKKDFYLKETYAQTKKDVVAKVAREGALDHDWVAALIRTQMTTTIKRLQADQLLAFRQGYSRVAPVETQSFILSSSNARLQFQERAEYYINKLTENVIQSLRRNVEYGEADAASKTRAVFDALEYRTTFIEDVEIRKARALGVATAIRNTASNVTVFSKTNNPDACPTCQSRNGQEISLTHLFLDALPPHHANCSCSIEQVLQGDVNTQDKVVDPNKGAADKPLEQEAQSADVAECPKCGKTAIRVKDTPDNFKCNACKTFFKTGEKVASKTPDSQDEMPGPISQMDSVEDGKGSRFARCTMKVSAKLRERHPDWSEDKIQGAAEMACIGNLVDENSLEDATLEECVLSVKKSLRKEHPDWSSDKIKSSAFAICKSKRKGK